MQQLIFSDPHIHFANEADLKRIQILLNTAYRGERSKKGWTTEADLIAGETRTDMESLINCFKSAGSLFLVYKDAEKKIAGCVNLQKSGNRVYLGMFAVEPELQGFGIGKSILQAAEEYTRSQSGKSIYMSVISVRKELIAWYKRKGYHETGEKKPFVEDGITGRHLQKLEFIILEKML
jgi:ribosomal protein S18 acetylase RimI-like enzyme